MPNRKEQGYLPYLNGPNPTSMFQGEGNPERYMRGLTPAYTAGPLISDAQSAEELAQEIARFNRRGPVMRFMLGAYNHPVTWWIGIFQIMGQMRLLGHNENANASIRASILFQVTDPLINELMGLLRGESSPILSAIVRYNLKYRKADISGRFLGGAFTNYASTGGRYGNQRLSRTGKIARMGVNFTLASYGAAIRAIGEGKRNAEAVIQAILTGTPEQIPSNYTVGEEPLTSEERELIETLAALIEDMISYTQISPGPVPIEEFCSRPENRGLRGLCK